ncbi:MAG: DNA polymerase III subunit alpha [Candidatus Aquicultor primus]|uniref:DNA polymerase III subunit alpha n=1 Tax=Candidatus Aquicultor primus TaxID=1797195 RepID=A0A1F2UJC7_9ACTN|nr:MAG: DNA polymerase III subunit alpha [Candidatus Aquicultor primus]HCH00094.1 DNA polymerase III subunit alpha [Actinomycetota bacterium]
MADFVHLHTHSEFSLLDGASRVKELVSKAKELGMSAIALTDHGVMYGIIEFFEEAQKQGIKPIIGCEVYVAPGSRFEKTRSTESYTHLLLLAENEQGYRNLMKLVALSFFEGFYYKPRVDKELLEQYHDGLIAASACLAGQVARHLNQDNYEAAKEEALYFNELFGEGNFYLEVQDHGLAEQKKVNVGMFKLSDELGLPVIATNDIHYTKQADAQTHDVLLCIQTGSTLAEPGRMKFETDEFYLKSGAEMAAIFPGRPEALQNTCNIADRCNVEIKFGEYLLPNYEIPEGYTVDEYFEKLCREGFAKRYPNPTEAHRERLEYEIGVIEQMGFPGYFLVVHDFVNYAKSNDIKVGPGRGSAAGSIVAYSLKITNIDPMEYNLLFERFLNPERISLPDIDIDFCFERRPEVIDYVTKKYGEDRVAQIITFGTMAAKAAIRDAGRVFDIPYGRVDKIAKLIPDGLHEGRQWTIDAALKVSQEMRDAYENDELTQRVIDMAKNLEGLVRQDSIHAAGVVIADQELTNRTPIQRKGGAEIVTQYSMGCIEKIGLLKMDFLGLRTLTVIDNAVKNIKMIHGVDIDIDVLPLSDETTYELLRRGESTGVFQLESSGMRALLRDLQPTAFTDIIALLALYRPGPLGSGMVKDFVDRKHGRKPISHLHPMLEPILKETYGVMVYQEQVMLIASTMAGFSMGEGDTLRKAMGKKLPEVLAKFREKFISGSVDNGVDANLAGKIFDLIVHFAGYGFNKSHSTAYAAISWQTAWLKANYPVEFMAALLTSIMGNKDKVAQYINECRRMGTEILPPDVNESYRDFTVVGKAIRFGLSAVRNVGEGVIEAIIREREENGLFRSIYDYCRRVDTNALNKRTIESLIKGGAFDSCKVSRRQLLLTFEKAVEIGARSQKDKASGQFTIFDLGDSGDSGTAEAVNDPIDDIVPEFDTPELLLYEKEMLGLYVSDHPLLGVADEFLNQTEYSTSELKEQKDGTVAWVGGIIAKITRLTTKKGDLMLFLNVEDLDGSVEVIVFPAVYDKFKDIIAEDKIVLIKGRLDIKEDEIKVISLEIREFDAKTGGKAANRRKAKPNGNGTSNGTSNGTINGTSNGKKLNGNSALVLTVSKSMMTAQFAERLKEILRTQPGPVPVFLKLQNGGEPTILALAPEYNIAPQNGLFAELKELCGEGAVNIE